MENNINIKNMGIVEIYKYFLYDLVSIYGKYEFAFISNDIITGIIFDEIRKSRYEYNNGLVYINYLKLNIERELNKIVTKKLKYDNNNLEIIKNYINYNNISNLEDLIYFFIDYDYIPDINLIIDLLDDKNTLEMVKRDLNENNNDNDLFGYIKSLFIKGYLIKCDALIDEDTCENTILNDYYDNEEVMFYKEYISEMPRLSKPEIKELFEKVRNNDKLARKKLIESHLYLALKETLKYDINKYNFNDLFEEACLGLIYAIDHYDESKGSNLQGYITWNIIFKLIKYTKDNDFDIENIRNWESGDIESYDESDKVLMKRDVSDLLNKCELTDLEREILILRYGFDGLGEKGQSEIKDIYGTTRQNIHQLESKALKKIRMHQDTKYLADYLDNPKSSRENLTRYIAKYTGCKKY